MICRDLYLIFFKYLAYLKRSVAFKGELKYASDHFGSLFINDPMIMIFGILKITIRRGTCNMLTGIALRLKGGTNLLTCVFGIPLIHDISERQEVIITMQGIGAVINGDKSYILLSEHLHDLTDFQIIPAQAAHVFHKDNADIAVLDLFHHFKKCRTVKACAGYSIICEMPRTWKLMRYRILHEKLFLI